MEEKKIIKIAIILIIIIILSYGIASILQKPIVVSTKPINKKEEVDLKTSIEITFNKPLSTSIEDKISIIPETKGTFSFDNKSLIFKKPKKIVFTPSEDLLSFTEYRIEIKEPRSWLGLKGEDESFSFLTKYIPWNKLSPEQQERETQTTEGADGE